MLLGISKNNSIDTSFSQTNPFIAVNMMYDALCDMFFVVLVYVVLN